MVSLVCGKCAAPLLWLESAEQLLECSSCQQVNEVYLFPPAWRDAKRPSFAAEALSDESVCLKHPGKRATLACESCGRFMCELCSIPLSGKNVCVECVDKGPAKNELAAVQAPLLRYDQITLLLGLLCIFLYIMSIILAPIVIFVAIRNWRRPFSILPRSRWRFVAGALIALLALSLWGLMFVGIFLSAFESA